MKMPVGTRSDSVAANTAETDKHRPAGGNQAKPAVPKGTGSSHHSDVPSWNGPQQAGGATAANGDPFTNGTSTNGAKLNGKAVSFCPVASFGPTGPISYLNDTSEAATGPVIVSTTSKCFTAIRPNGPGKAVQQPVGTPGQLVTPKRAKITFSTDVGPGVSVPGGHYMKMEKLPASDAEQTLKALNDNFGWEKKLNGCVAPPSANGQACMTVWLAFDDMRDAANACDNVKVVNATCHLSYIPQTEYATGILNAEGRGIQMATSFYDGQVTLLAKFSGRGNGSEADGLYEYVKGTATQFGDIVGGGVNEKIVDANVRHYHIEFFKISDAKFMAEAMTDEPGHFKRWTIRAVEIPDHTHQQTPQHAVAMSGTPYRLAHGTETQYASPTGRSAWTVNKKGRVIAVPGQRQLPKLGSIKTGVNLTPLPRYIRGSDASPHTPASAIPGITYGTPHPSAYTPAMTVPRRSRLQDIGPNRIIVQRIEDGIDVRTTLMVRNIPNDMDFDMFKTVLDKVLFGRYNFVYLRFDFTKATNVGYAFVNFLTPGDLLTFYHAYNGKEYIEGMGRHPLYGPRLGEMAYATVQGDDCSIEKFRNSSIMCEYDGYRPKLFYTVIDAPSEALVGKERPFPGINNMSKHNRSKDNAAHIGLYAPRHRQGPAALRASQYDRGTPAQMQEDAFFHQQQVAQQFMGYGHVDSNYIAANRQASMPVGMPAGPYGLMYGPPSPYYHTTMNGTPTAYSPTGPIYYGTPGPVAPNGFSQPAWIGSPAPMTGNGVPPSRLRTITQGRLGNGPRRPAMVHPGRDLETAERQIEEGKRIQAKYDAHIAAGEYEAAEALKYAPVADVPRFMNGEEPTNGNGVHYNANGTNDGAYSNGGYHSTSYQ